MPILDNPKHEQYASFLARNMPQGKAYQKAGYTANAGAASRLAAAPDIKARVEDLREENNRAVVRFMDDTTVDNAKSLVELGLTRNWCAVSFKEVYDKALEEGQFSAANAAVVNIQKLVDMENGTDDGTTKPGNNSVDLTAVTDMLKAAKELLIHERIPAEAPEPGEDAIEVN